MKPTCWVSAAMLVLFLAATRTMSQESVKAAPADNAPIPLGTCRVLQSKVLGEYRTLLIRLPADYARSDKKYPVLYKLDGGREVFTQTVGTIEYLTGWYDWIPDHIVIGIANTNRSRDMDPSRGGNDFLRFLTEELTPFIDANYRTNGYRIFCGQSASSFLALYSFLREPDAFDGCVLSSFGLVPSGNGRSMLEEALRKMPARTKPRAFIYVANGKVDSYDPDGARAKNGSLFLESLEKAAGSTLRIKQRDYEEEGHVPFPSIYDGLKWIYSEKAPATTKQGVRP
jgi:uncharacterized protein